jgi:cyclophilin family peptidyl-prolyl cis-trans isomerase
MFSRYSSIEPLETRIAPAAIINGLGDIVAGAGKTGETVDLSYLFDGSVENPNRTLVQFTTNFDTDLETPGLQAGIIRLELFDDEAPLTVQNFLSYVNNENLRGDYDGTFFHRAVSGFILQGGGFETREIREHIPVGFEVHNEFDASRSNVRGTIAMAKTDIGPNTATSEFFFNLADNSGNLDRQNGGFTVFGRVTAGLDVIDQIVALPRTNQGGALTDLPVQKGYADVPGNEPERKNLVAITDARVLSRAPGDTTGASFQVGERHRRRDERSVHPCRSKDRRHGSQAQIRHGSERNGQCDHPRNAEWRSGGRDFQRHGQTEPRGPV